MAKNLKIHPLVAKLACDPTRTPDVVPLTGFVGPSSRENHYRIYHDLGLSSYTDVPADAIEHSEEVYPDNENSPSVVFVKKGTRVHSVQSVSHDVGADYVGGRIASSELPGASSEAAKTEPAGTTPFSDLCTTFTQKYK